MNDVNLAPYNTPRATAAVKHVARMSAGLVSYISRRYAFAWLGRARELQWEFAFGTAVTVAFKILLRYGDLSRCLWEPVY